MPHDPDVLRERLRADTARMLGVDLKNMTAAQEVRLSRATLLRLELDDIETAKFNGRPFDVKAYVAASEALERLVGGDPERATATHDFSGAREELARFFEGRARALDRRRERDEAAQAAAVVPPFDPDAPPSRNVRTTYIDVATIAPSGSPPVPTPVSPLRHQSLHASCEVPAHYLKNHQPQEPWRSFVDENGISTGNNGAAAPLKRGADWSPRRDS